MTGRAPCRARNRCCQPVRWGSVCLCTQSPLSGRAFSVLRPAATRTELCRARDTVCPGRAVQHTTQALMAPCTCAGRHEPPGGWLWAAAAAAVLKKAGRRPRSSSSNRKKGNSTAVVGRIALYGCQHSLNEDDRGWALQTRVFVMHTLRSTPATHRPARIFWSSGAPSDIFSTSISSILQCGIPAVSNQRKVNFRTSGIDVSSRGGAAGPPLRSVS